MGLDKIVTTLTKSLPRAILGLGAFAAGLGAYEAKAQTLPMNVIENIDSSSTNKLFNFTVENTAPNIEENYMISFSVPGFRNTNDINSISKGIDFSSWSYSFIPETNGLYTLKFTSGDPLMPIPDGDSGKFHFESHLPYLKSVQVTATAAGNGSNPNTPFTPYTVQIPVSAIAPLITNQPLDTLVQEGGNTNLNVGASGAPLNYQWLFNSNAINGATNSTLNFTNIQQTNAQGNYSVIVSNSAGAVTSSVAQVTVNRQPYAMSTNAGGQQGSMIVYPIAKLKSNFRDTNPDNDLVNFNATSATTLNGSPASYDGTNILISPTGVGNDVLTYTVKDSRNGIGTGQIMLTVLSSNAPSFNMTGIYLQTNGIRVEFAGIPFTSYKLDRSTNANGPWQQLADILTAQNGKGTFLDTNPPPQQGYYRTR